MVQVEPIEVRGLTSKAVARVPSQPLPYDFRASGFPRKVVTLSPTSPTATSAAERSRNTPMSKLHGTEVRRSHHHRSVINAIEICIANHRTSMRLPLVSFAGDSRFRLSGGGHIKEINRLVGGEH
jgi:hypothetical protein